MSYICINTDCSAPENKKDKVYPSAMECPFCDVPLIEKITVSESDSTLIASLPYVIAYPLRRTLAEKHMWTKVNLLKDTFLNYLKYLGLLAASEFFNSNLKDKKMVALFQQALAEPSFGSWNQFIRETLQFLKEQQHVFFCAELVAYYEAVETGKKRKLYKGEIEYIDSNGDVQLKKQEATAIGMLINFRNRYLGHGLTRDEQAAQKLWDEYFPLFRNLLEQMQIAANFPMFKHEHGETYILQSAELSTVEKGPQTPARVWLEDLQGRSLDILPFYVVPGEVSLAKDDKEQILAYESYTGKTIKFFSPEGTEKQTSGKILEKLNLLLRDKQKERAYAPEEFTQEIFMARVADENKLILDTLISEKKVIPGVYVHREEMEIKLREWIGARMSIFFIAAEAGSGKTNLLVEMQKQYTERGIPTLLIRAGRMEKQTLREQLAYLLNIDATQDLSSYKHIAGTQASPTMVLIDGLNEAAHSETLWQEVLAINKTFEPGSLKFVVTSRANSKADIERYALAESDESLVYGENKDHEQGLGAYTHWLTALNMAEMKNAWDDYMQKDKNKYKPQFSFDDLAAFDRALYNQICNPLVLRLFLETYHNKALPKKRNKHLNIWADWLATFTDTEQEFFKLLADAIWEKGDNELLLDDVLKNEKLKPYFTDDRINAPYPRLKNNGWISRYVKDLNACVAFTVEGALLFIFGKQLQHKSTQIDVEFIDKILEQGSKLQKAGLEAFLCEEGMRGELGLITNLIDEGGNKLEICIRPLLHYLKVFGVEDTLSKLLEDTTENDWQAMLKLNKVIDELQLQVLRKELLYKAIEHIEFSNKYDTELGLIAINAIDDEQARVYYAKINGKADFLQHETQLLFELGRCEERFARYDNALEYYHKGLNIELNTLGSEHLYVANSYSVIGKVWSLKGEFDKALECLYKCREIQIKAFGDKHSSLATTYSIIGVIWDNKGEYDKSLELYQMSLDNNLTTYGSEHPSVAHSYNCIGSIFQRKGEYLNALEFYQKSLDICIKIFGLDSPLVAIIYNNIGLTWKYKGEYDKALSYFQSCLKIQKKIYGAENPFVATTYNNIGVLFYSKGEHDKALEFFQSCLDIQMKILGFEHPIVATLYNNIGEIWRNKEEYNKALDFYQKSLDIQLKTLGLDHPDLGTTYNNIGEVWRNKEDYDKALDYYQKSLDIQMEIFGEEHPSVGFLYGNFGRVWNDKGEIEKALDFFQKSLGIQLKVLGEEHPSVGELYGEIGMIKLMNGEIDVALDYYHKYIDIQIKTLGEEHLSVGNLYDAIAMMHLFNFESNKSLLGDNIQQYSNECDKVIDYYQKSLSIKLINLGVENLELIPTYNSISSAYLKKGDNNKALESYMKSLDIQIKTLGGEHLDVGTSYWNIGCCFQEMKEYTSAIKAFNNGYKIQRKGGYPFRIANCHEQLGNKIEALDYFIQSAEIRKDDPEVGLTDETTIASIENAIRLAKQLGKENELPEWILNHTSNS